MKKTILAMAVPALLAAGAAQASVNLYDADGVSVDLSGAAEIQYYKGYSESEDANLRIDDADLFLSTAIAVSDTLDAVAGMGFKYEDQFNGTLSNDNGAVKNDELWVGFASSEFGSLTFGRQLLLSDDAGNQKDYELGTEQIDFVVTQGSQVIKWVYDNGTFYAGANVDLDQDKADSTDGRQILGGRIGARYEGLDGRVYLYDAEDISGEDVSGFNAELNWVITDAFDVALSYGQVDYKIHTNTSDKTEVDVFGISGGYQADEKTYFAVGYDIIDTSPSANGSYAKKETNSLYANATYKVATNAKVYAEVGVTDQEVNNADVNTDTGYVLGMEVKF
ncbi:porin [Enterovibrio norvegicus FF-33]|uniref:porin n=1 Tax=Enterovibrio norvegicus TaxID=188144 RepID=UPI00037B7CF5|nr:porin [Enterovibrio norvegicus]OEE68024.1 porin [Enterovibrio norvegicus FF-33]